MCAFLSEIQACAAFSWLCQKVSQNLQITISLWKAKPKGLFVSPSNPTPQKTHLLGLDFRLSSCGRADESGAAYRSHQVTAIVIAVVVIVNTLNPCQTASTLISALVWEQYLHTICLLLQERAGAEHPRCLCGTWQAHLQPAEKWMRHIDRR